MKLVRLALLLAPMGLFVGACGSESAVADDPSPVFVADPEEEREDEEEFEAHDGPCSREGTELADLVNQYRVDHDLPPVPISVSLCAVAEAHLEDILEFEPYNAGEDCALQSWSDNAGVAGCCYANDHSNAECMWDKPSQLTEYPGLGYESVALNTESVEAVVQQLTGFAGHSELFLEESSFAHVDWRALGVAYRDGSATIWLGAEDDPVQE